MLRKNNEIQKDRRQNAQKAHTKPRVCQENGTSKKQNRRTGNRNIGKLYQYEKSKHTRNKKCQQTRTNGIINLEPQEILTLCCEKTKYFDSSAIPKSREEPSFFKNDPF